MIIYVHIKDDIKKENFNFFFFFARIHIRSPCLWFQVFDHDQSFGNLIDTINAGVY